MELDRDPTDQGVARTLSATELEEVRAQAAAARQAARRRDWGLTAHARPAGDPAVPAQRQAPSRSPRSLRLLTTCGQCGSPIGRWCRVTRREVTGHLHECRQAPDQVPDTAP